MDILNVKKMDLFQTWYALEGAEGQDIADFEQKRREVFN